MNHVRVAAIVGVGMMFATASALAGVTSFASPQLVKPGSQVEQIRYVNPEAVIGGVISGVIGGALGGSCYYNDCGYGDGYYGGGGYFGGGGGGGYRGGRGGGGHVGGSGHANVSHAAGGHGRR